MTLLTPSLPPRRKMNRSFLPLVPILPSAMARRRKGGRVVIEASPRASADAEPDFRKDRRVMILAIRIRFEGYVATVRVIAPGIGISTLTRQPYCGHGRRSRGCPRRGQRKPTERRPRWY